MMEVSLLLTDQPCRLVEEVVSLKELWEGKRIHDGIIICMAVR